MRSVNMIYWINKVWLIITFVLFVTIYLGLFAELVLGCIQIISSIILFFYRHRMSDKLNNQLYIYWFILFIYLLLYLTKILNDAFWIIGFCIIPMSIALYFFKILYDFKSEMKLKLTY